MTDETHGTPKADDAAARPKRMDLSNIRDLPLPERKPQREIKVDLPPYEEREGVSAHDRLALEKERRPGAVAKLARTLTGFAIFAVLLLGVYLVAHALDDNSKPTAAWSKPGAPVVRPSVLGDQ